ncbi:unnamed protein product [Adineta steineri]|uniref:Uncharacterized protein n=1 Tax=Adineta steineri TaxID=433720 RepID=A0A813ZKA2_9BILA|nr:unnamed protein product [Adineta steineri]CAF1210024.1 unnamed protein product [Adineta steineri]
MDTTPNINPCTSQAVRVEPQSNTKDFHQKLPCKGHACTHCGKCRDWYWTANDSSWIGGYKYYMKRPDATCTGCYGGRYDDQYDCDCCCGGGSYYHYFWACCCFGRHCECNDNRFPV